jgi:iron complex transport system ATP-binding protein
MVELRNVTQRVGSAVLLDDVSVRFRPGRFNVILGPNGAGKSTLLRLASGLARPTSGEVRYDDEPVSAYTSEQLARMRAVLSQHVELAFALPVVDVVAMGRYPHYGRTPSLRDHEIVDRALELVGMAAKREQPYPTLSGGERQKVQLARVLAQIWSDDAPGEPRYLFLDEPTAGLDVHYRLHILQLARGLLGPDCTVVAILHDLNVAFEYGDHFLLLEGGRVAIEAEESRAIPAAVLERVFRVRARREASADGAAEFWRFSL